MKQFIYFVSKFEKNFGRFEAEVLKLVWVIVLFDNNISQRKMLQKQEGKILGGFFVMGKMSEKNWKQNIFKDF